MNKKEFLEIVNDYLKGAFSEYEISDIIREYEEFFLNEEIRGKTEEEIVNSLGSPKTIANNHIDKRKNQKSNQSDIRPIKIKSQNPMKNIKSFLVKGLNRCKNLIDLESVKDGAYSTFSKILIILFTIIIVLPITFVVATTLITTGGVLITGSITTLTTLVFSFMLLIYETYIGIFIFSLVVFSIGILIALWTVFINIVILSKNKLLLYIFFIKKRFIGTQVKNKKEEVKLQRDGKERRSKRALIISVTILTIGLIGSISSGFYSITKLRSEVEKNLENISAKEKDIAVFNDDARNIYLDFQDENYSVIFRKSKDNLFHIKTYEEFENDIKVDKSYESNMKALILKTKSNNRVLKGLDIKEGISDIITRSYILDYKINRKLIVEVPKAVDIGFVNLGNSENSEVIVEDREILKDNFIAKYSMAKIKLPYFNNLKKIVIESNGNIELDLREVVNAKDVIIKASGIDIYSGGEIYYYNIKTIPENFSIYTNRTDINSFIPLGKTVNIDTSNWVDLKMPFDNYNISGKISNKSTYSELEEFEFMKLNNLKFNIKGNSYEGKYSSYEGDEYKMNIKTFNGMLTNTSMDVIINYVRKKQSYVSVSDKEYDNVFYERGFADRIINTIKEIVVRD